MAYKDPEKQREYQAGAKYREAQHKYRVSPEGREAVRKAQHKYYTSQKGREARREVEASPKTRETRRKYRASPAGNDTKRKYRSSSKGRDAARKRVYGMEEGEYDSMYTTQGGCCKICLRAFPPEGRDGLHIDHDHSTKKIRGLLCRACNHMLVRIDEDPANALRAYEYVTGNRDHVTLEQALLAG